MYFKTRLLHILCLLSLDPSWWVSWTFFVNSSTDTYRFWKLLEVLVSCRPSSPGNSSIPDSDKSEKPSIRHLELIFITNCCFGKLFKFFVCTLIINMAWNLNNYTPRKRISGGYIEITLSVCLSVCLSICLSVCADSCPAHNSFYGLTLAYHIWHMDVSP